MTYNPYLSVHGEGHQGLGFSFSLSVYGSQRATSIVAIVVFQVLGSLYFETGSPLPWSSQVG